MSSTKSKNFQKVVWSHYKKHGRHHLPWRKTRNPYRILVSEVMLQQTQVKRVVDFYSTFTKRFPTVRKLAHAPLSDVLKSWQGLGYNRRAKNLHRAAKEIVARHKGVVPRDVDVLEMLSGIGHYTARAIGAFAHNDNVVFIETNIRTVVIHHFFRLKEAVSDAEVEKILIRALPFGKARQWYFALMDYGAYLKQSGVKVNAKSKHYSKQSKFAGSNREARGAILRALAGGGRTQSHLLNLLGASRRVQMRTALPELLQEHLIEKRATRYRLPH